MKMNEWMNESDVQINTFVDLVSFSSLSLFSFMLYIYILHLLKAQKYQELANRKVNRKVYFSERVIAAIDVQE